MIKPDMEKLSQKAQLIVSAIDKESIDVYLFLKNKFIQEKVSENPLFHFVYRSFYRLDNAGLTAQFKSEYFRCLERCRDSNDIDLAGLIRKLYQFPNLKGQNSLQFSFVTKLANMIDDTYPIYDSEVARIFHFRPPSNNLSFEDRLSGFLDFHSKLKEYYSGLLQDDTCHEIFVRFYEHFPDETRRIPEVKLLDFFFWSAGKLQAKEDS